MSWIIDWVPWWVWATIIFVVAAATINIWLPAATFVWSRLPQPVRWLLGGFVFAVGAYLAGRNRGRRNAVEEQRRRDAAAIRRRLETNREIEQMTPEERSEERRRWERD